VPQLQGFFHASAFALTQQAVVIGLIKPQCGSATAKRKNCRVCGGNNDRLDGRKNA
jgi:hypothetical protein